MTYPTEQNQQGGDAFPRNRPSNSAAVNVGSVSIEQERAIAEAQGQLVLAKRFPRDLMAAHADLMAACKIRAFAEVAFYNVPRAGGSVSGPSIRLAEEVARAFGNFQYGHRELSRDDKKSEVEVFAWDMQANNRSIRQLTVYHVRDTKSGAQPLRDQKDIDDKIANVASKQVRGRILALVPKFLVQEAIEECRRTIAGGNGEPLEARIRKMSQAFGKFGVNQEMLERYLEHPLKDTMAEELADLMGIHNAIRDGAKASEFFKAKELPLEEAGSAADDLNAQAAGGAKADDKPKQERKPRQTKKVEPTPEPEPEVQEPDPVPEDVQEGQAPEQGGNDPQDEQPEDFF